MTTRGLALFNPMNLMTSPSILWQGEVKPTCDPDGRLCQFDSYIDGIRAGTKNLLAYFLKDGCKTVRQIIERYAPSVENPTGNYVDFIADWCSVGADDIIDMTDKVFVYRIVSGIIHFEQGSDFCTQAQIQNGITQAFASLPSA